MVIILKNIIKRFNNKIGEEQKDKEKDDYNINDMENKKEIIDSKEIKERFIFINVNDKISNKLKY